MSTFAIASAFGAAVLALAARSLMKRILGRKAGAVVYGLLEIDFWKASSGSPAAKALLALELASWAGLIVAITAVASGTLGL